MSIDLLKQYYRAFNDGDSEGMLALLADGVVHDINQGEREVGRVQFAKFLKHMEECYSEQIIHLALMGDDSGTRFAAEFTVVGRYLKADPGFPAARGQSYRLPAGAFFEIEGGQITRVTTYYNLKDWLKQVGEVT